jgi:hypothetical protein
MECDASAGMKNAGDGSQHPRINPVATNIVSCNAMEARHPKTGRTVLEQAALQATPNTVSTRNPSGNGFWNGFTSKERHPKLWRGDLERTRSKVGSGSSRSPPAKATETPMAPALGTLRTIGKSPGRSMIDWPAPATRHRSEIQNVCLSPLDSPQSCRGYHFCDSQGIVSEKTASIPESDKTALFVTNTRRDFHFHGRCRQARRQSLDRSSRLCR